MFSHSFTHANILQIKLTFKLTFLTNYVMIICKHKVLVLDSNYISIFSGVAVLELRGMVESLTNKTSCR